ncbi:cell division protein ZipA [Pseudidiomarina sp.]|uniref:cell division protein ZipA n=1 Tax=Pseudidiomarina sp. TaxID=2081707 RepID=UPI00299E1463|nr:cell division protein ZipA [Pseudidiomarina sp.]MDX1706217.1 cell division protein ZipA [Pseudidiomarina sp.]
MTMMQIVFSIIGLLLIIAIVAHGMWTIRRNEQKQRERMSTIEQKRHQADADSFDGDGIGPVRIVSKKAQAGEAKEGVPPAANTTKMRANSDDAEVELPSVSAEPDPVQQQQKPPAKSAKAEQPKPEKPEKAEPVSQPAQQSMDLPLERDEDEPILTEEPEEVIALHVTGDIQGAVLLQQMTELGFKYGDFDIFHRHVDTAGNGPVLFSLANMFKPGTFDIDNIEAFHTEGVALFLALPIKGNSTQAFTMMHNAAVKLATAVDKGQVLDEQRNPLTRQALQHIHQRIREFERKRLIRH